MEYDFSALNDKEFEQFTRDILNFQFKLDLQSFKPGRDGGIDLRYSTTKNRNSIVVQAKHYFNSGVRKLINDLKKTEVDKVQNLKPDRYIVVTSLALTAKNKDDIYDLFKPYLQSSNDVMDRADLNKYLVRFPNLHRQWFKLWLSSTSVLDSILNNSISGRSLFYEEKIRRLIRLYVPCRSYDNASVILSKHKYILITGQPGVGKTTLAHLLTYQLLSKGYQLVYIDADVKEAEQVFSPDSTVKQVFFFDDFLGSNYLETLNPKTSESSFVNFLERVRNTKGKYLILTTRTSVFRSALEKYEKMQRIRVDIARKEIELGDYSDWDKARILYNHLFHSRLSARQRSEVFSNYNYWKIIKHKNYNPRLIEFITDEKNVHGSYLEFALKNLDNPEAVWKYAYERQVTTEERILINVVFSHLSHTTAENTREQFDVMLSHEVTQHNYTPSSNPFNNACKKLLDGIIRKETYTSDGSESFGFVNPSLNDFLKNYFIENEEERWKLISGSVFIEQFEQYTQYFFNYFNTPLQNIHKHASRFVEYILASVSHIRTYKRLGKERNASAYLHLRIASLLSKFYTLDKRTGKKVDQFMAEAISNYNVDTINNETWDYYISIIKDPSFDSLVFHYVDENWKDIICALFTGATLSSDFEEIMALFSDYNKDYGKFIRDRDAKKIIQAKLDDYVDAETADWVGDMEGEVFSEEEWDELRTKIKAKRSEIFDEYLLDDENYDESYFLDEEDMEDLIEKNELRRKKSKGESPLIAFDKAEELDSQEFEKEINALFVGRHERTKKSKS